MRIKSTIAVFRTIAVTAIAAGLLSAPSLSVANPISGYVTDNCKGGPIKSGTGLCWRTGYWNQAMATAECDPDLIESVPAPTLTAKPIPVLEEPTPPSMPMPRVVPAHLKDEVKFEFNMHSITEAELGRLDAFIQRLRAVAPDAIFVIGHADRIGSAQYNQKLSKARANAVKQYLVKKGVSASFIYTEGKGESQPLAGTECTQSQRNGSLKSCLAPNRRVDISIIGTIPK